MAYSHSVTTTKKAYISVRVNENRKHNAEKILEKLGLSMSDAINMLLSQINLNKGLPFVVKIPNKETLEAFKDSEKDINCTIYKNPEEMYKDLGL